MKGTRWLIANATKGGEILERGFDPSDFTSLTGIVGT